MGFEQFIASDNFVSPEIKRGFISDSELTRKIISTYETEKQTGKPGFIFAISVQNHGSYSSSDYSPEQLISADFLPESTADEETQGNIKSYLTGVKYADAALGELIKYFESVKEPTIIVFFGDHFPQLQKQYRAFKEIGFISDDVDSLENNYKLHAMDFVAWNNFSRQKESDYSMSQYQLVPFLSQKFDLPRPVFFDYLNEQREVYAGNALTMYLDENGKVKDSLTPIQKEYMNTHKLFQYDILMGNEYSKDILYR